MALFWWGCTSLLVWSPIIVLFTSRVLADGQDSGSSDGRESSSSSSSGSGDMQEKDDQQSAYYQNNINVESAVGQDNSTNYSKRDYYSILNDEGQALTFDAVSIMPVSCINQ